SRSVARSWKKPASVSSPWPVSRPLRTAKWSLSTDHSPQKRQSRPRAALLMQQSAYRPDMCWIAALSSSSEQSPQGPFGGMALMPLMAFFSRPSRPPDASALAFQAAESPVFGELSRPVEWQAVQNLPYTSAPLRAAPPAATAAPAPAAAHSWP